MPKTLQPLTRLKRPEWGPWLLAALCLAGLAARAWVAATAPWYWDEGYVADVAASLARLQRPQSGALWANGLLPLTASWLAPLSAAPFTYLFPSEPILGVRAWAALLGALTAGGLGLLAKRLGGWRWGLAAGGLLALAPFAAALGGLGLYQHLGGALGVAAFGLALARDEGDAPGPDWLPWLLAGLAAASCYWLWWLPLGLLLRGRERGVAGWARALALGFGLPATALGLALLSPGGPGMFRVLRGFSAGLQTPGHYLASLRAFPFVWLGLPGLVLLGRRRAWLSAAVALGFLDLLRQRGSLIGSPYVLAPLLPWAALGLTVLAFRLGERARILLPLGLALALAAGSVVETDWIRRLSVSPAMTRNLRNFIATRRCAGRVVLSVPPADALLAPYARPAGLDQAGAWRGVACGFLPAGTPKQAFAFAPALEDAAYLAVGRAHFNSSFLNPNQALEALRAERLGWPVVFQNPEYRVFANPRTEGLRPDPQVRVLLDPEFYRLAAADADAQGLAELAAFARSRAASARAADLPAGRSRP